MLNKGLGGRSAVSIVLQTVFTQTEVNTECPFSSRQSHTEDEPDDSRRCLVMASTFLPPRGRSGYQTSEMFSQVIRQDFIAVAEQ